MQVGVGHAAHRGVRFGPEVLHDDFLDVPVLAGGAAQREQRLGAFGAGFTDADEDAASERHRDATGVGEHPQPDGGFLVRAAEMRAAPLAPQPLGGGLQHHAHARRDRLEPGQLRPAQHAGVQVRQQAGFLQHRDRAGPHIVHCGGIAARFEPLPGGGPALFRPVAQGEQGLLAARGRALPGDFQHLVAFQVRGFHPVRHGGEGAVVAAIPAQPGQRDEHVAAVGDHAWMSLGDQVRVPRAPGGVQQFLQVIAASVQQDRGLGGVQRNAIGGAAESTTHGRRARGGLRRGQFQIYNRHPPTLSRKSPAAQPSSACAMPHYRLVNYSVSPYR